MTAALLLATLAASPGPSRRTADGGTSLVDAARVKKVAIDADKLEILGGENRAIYSGHAKATRDSTTIGCDQLVVAYSAKGQRRDVSRVQCIGHVVITDGERVATGENADFDNLTGVLVVTGNPEARQGPNHVAGSKVTFTMGSDTIQVDDARTVFVQGPAQSAQASPRPSQLQIDAKTLTIERGTNRAIWSGGVKARKETLQLSCDRLIAHHTGEEVTRLEALGGVEVKDGDRWARGRRADFDNTRGVLVVTGKPVAGDGPNTMEGSKVIFTVGKKTLEVENARTVIHTGSSLIKGRP